MNIFAKTVCTFSCLFPCFGTVIAFETCSRPKEKILRDGKRGFLCSESIRVPMQELNRKSARIPRSLLWRSGNPVSGATGNASESKTHEKVLVRSKIPCSLLQGASLIETVVFSGPGKVAKSSPLETADVYIGRAHDP